MKKLLNRGKKAAQSTEAKIIREEVKKKKHVTLQNAQTN
jgi:hypothetical protein